MKLTLSRDWYARHSELDEPVEFAAGVASAIHAVLGQGATPLVRMQSLPLAASSGEGDDLSVGQLLPGRYQVDIEGRTAEAHRAKIEIQPHVGGVRLRLIEGEVLQVLADEPTVLRSDRWVVVTADPSMPLKNILECGLSFQGVEVQLADSK